MSSKAKRRMLVLITAVSLITLPVVAVAEITHSGGPQDGRTGAPGETDCTACHAGGAGDGSLTLSGVPAGYGFGQTYTITVTLQDPGQQRWGFEVTAVDEAGDGAGTFTITDPANTQLSDNSDPQRDYVKHTSAGTQNGTPDGPVNWSFDWTSPAEDAGEITFYAAGNAANGNNGTSGDFIYTTSAAMSAGATSIPSISTIGALILMMLMLGAGFYCLRRPQTAK